MTRINTNVSSLTAQNALANSQSQLQTALTRLSTGLQINSGADNPAGLIEAQNLGTEITADNSAISNSNQANDLISTADSALSQVSTLLNTIRGLVSDAANTGALTSSQIAADQLQVDSSLQAIDQISQTTEFQGSKLLDGSLDFQTTSAGTTGLKASGTFGTSAVDTKASGTVGSVALTAKSAGTAANSLVVKYVSGAASGGATSASYAAGTLTVSVYSAAATDATAAIAAVNVTANSAGVAGNSINVVYTATAATTTAVAATYSGGTITVAITSSTTTSGEVVAAINALSGTPVAATTTSSATTVASTISTALSGGAAAAASSTGEVVAAINALSGSPVAATTTHSATTVASHIYSAGSLSGGAASNEFTVAAKTYGSQNNDVTVKIVSGASSGGAATASFSGGVITVTAKSGATTASQIVAAINAGLGTQFSAAAVGSGSGDVALGTLSASTSGGTTVNAISGLQINQANFGSSSSVPVNISIEKQATQAELVYTGGTLSAASTLQIGGSNGYQVFDFGAGATTTQIASAINNATDATGVTATTNSSGALVLQSQDYGTSNFVSVNALTGTFATKDTSGDTVTRATGTDIEASINGVQATGDGLQVSLDSSNLNLSFNVSADEPVTTTTPISFNITGGGATFQLGPDVTSSQQVTLGIQGVSTATLGGSDGTLYELSSGGAADLSTNPSLAATIVNEVIDQVTSLQGRLGAFQSTTLQTNISSLTDAVSNLTSAQSDIQDADYATETAALTRAQVLVQAGTSVLSIANQEPQQVLSLLKSAGG